MPRNTVQFQKGLSEAKFDALYGSEAKCRQALFSWRWPEGFMCPACGGMRYCIVKQEGRELYQCNACRTQTSLIAGTIFASTKLELTVWFRAMYHMTQTKQGISRLELSRRLGVSYNTAWKIHHKLAQVMMERERAKPLEGRVEVDDAYLAGRHLPQRQRQACAPSARRVRLPLQPALRSRCHDPAPRLGRRANVAYAIPPAEAG